LYFFFLSFFFCTFSFFFLCTCTVLSTCTYVLVLSFFFFGSFFFFLCSQTKSVFFVLVLNAGIFFGCAIGTPLKANIPIPALTLTTRLQTRHTPLTRVLARGTLHVVGIPWTTTTPRTARSHSHLLCQDVRGGNGKSWGTSALVQHANRYPRLFDNLSSARFAPSNSSLSTSFALAKHHASP
jgi:hypothetical protein